MRLDLKAEARTDLREIYDYGLARFGEDTVEAYLAEMREAFGRLLDFPRSGSLFGSVKPPIRSRADGIAYSTKSRAIRS